MAVENGNFSAAGTAPYEAASWERSFARGGRFAAFGMSLLARGEGTETFEDRALKKRFTGFYQDLTIAFFDFSGQRPQSVEDFEDLWGATHARVVSEALAPFALADGQTLVVRVNEGPEQTLTFRQQAFHNIARAGAEELANVIRAQLQPGASARLDQHHARRVELLTNRTGVRARIEVLGGTAMAALRFPEGAQYGALEAAGFYKQSEFDFLDFDAATAETEDFTAWPGALDAQLDRRKRFTLMVVEPFTDPLYLRKKDAWTLVPPEPFSADWPDTLTNYGES
jgi:hypothetical protein